MKQTPFELRAYRRGYNYERKRLRRVVMALLQPVPELTSELFYRDRKAFEMLKFEQTLIEGRNLALKDVLTHLVERPTGAG